MYTRIRECVGHQCLCYWSQRRSTRVVNRRHDECTIHIPAWWHNCITGVGQQFDSMKEVRLGLSTTQLRRNMCLILGRMIQEGLQLNTQIRRRSSDLGGSMHLELYTSIELSLKNLIMSPHVVEIWILMGIREHPENGHQLF